MHAEMNAVRFAQDGDELYVMRWLKDGETLTMAKPCGYCIEHIEKSGIEKVHYTDWEGDWKTMKSNFQQYYVAA